MKHAFQFNFMGNINVQNMQRQSGIFIGEQNHATGWSTHGKENSVIGRISGQSNLLFQNISILDDQDFIDTPIDDRDINISVENPSQEDHASFTLGAVNVNSMQQNSSVFVGKSHVTGMDANEKANHSQGSVMGNLNQFLNNVNINNDQDLIDGVMEDQDIKITHIQKETD